MDYKKLIEALRDEYADPIDYVDDAADAIEALVAEREELMSQICGKCGLCANVKKCVFDDATKRDCATNGRRNWKWRGPSLHERQPEMDGENKMDEITLESLCGEHYLSGVELTSEEIDLCYGMEPCEVLLFTLDGITYKMAEDPDDGYRSYCKEIKISEKPPRYSFQSVKVICSMMENSNCEKNHCIVIRDSKNGKTIIEAGTKNYDDWYPYCHFRYTPENMACNQ